MCISLRRLPSWTYLASVNLTGEATVQLDGNYTDALYYDFADTVTVTITPASGWEISVCRG